MQYAITVHLTSFIVYFMCCVSNNTIILGHTVTDNVTTRLSQLAAISTMDISDTVTPGPGGAAVTAPSRD